MVSQKKKLWALALSIVAVGAFAKPVQAQYYSGYGPWNWFRTPWWPLRGIIGTVAYNNYNPLYLANSAAYGLANVASPYAYNYYRNGYYPYYGPRYPMQMQQYQDPEPIFNPRVRTKQKRQMPLVVDQTTNAGWQPSTSLPPGSLPPGSLPPAGSQMMTGAGGNRYGQVPMMYPAEIAPTVLPAITQAAVTVKPGSASKFVDFVNQKHFGNISSALFDPDGRALARQCGVIGQDDMFDADFSNDRLELMRGIMQDQSLSPETRAQTVGVLIKHRNAAASSVASTSSKNNWH